MIRNNQKNLKKINYLFFLLYFVVKNIPENYYILYPFFYLGIFINKRIPIGTKISVMKKFIQKHNIPTKINKIPKLFLLSKKMLRRKIIPQMINNIILFVIKYSFDFTYQCFSRVFNC